MLEIPLAVQRENLFVSKTLTTRSAASKAGRRATSKISRNRHGVFAGLFWIVAPEHNQEQTSKDSFVLQLKDLAFARPLTLPRNEVVANTNTAFATQQVYR
jgi:hypothetical protein